MSGTVAQADGGEDWGLLMSFFPDNWEELAIETGALKGLRKDKSPENLLRMLLIHLGCGHSLRETVGRARHAHLADLSDVALLKRLRKSRDWLYATLRGTVPGAWRSGDRGSGFPGAGVRCHDRA